MSSNPNEYRQKCIEEKGDECVNCGSGENIEVHHIDGDRDNNDIDNLAPVCKSCHQKIHKSDGELDSWTEKLLPQSERGGYRTVNVKPDTHRELDGMKPNGVTWDYWLREQLLEGDD